MFYAVIIGFLVGILIVGLPIYFAQKERRLSRKQYAARIIGSLIIISAVVGYLIIVDKITISPGTLFTDNPYATQTTLMTALAMSRSIVFIIPIVAILITLWSVYRVQDVGWSRWTNAVLLIPILSLVWIIVLMLAPQRS